MSKSKMRDIILFTIKENIKKKGLLITTLILAVILVGIFPIMAKVSLDEKKDNTVENLIIYDRTEFKNAGYEGIPAMDDTYKNIKVKYNDYSKKNEIEFDKDIKLAIAENKGMNNLIVGINHTDSINIDLTIPKSSRIKESDANRIGDSINKLLVLKKYESTAKDEGELLELMAEVTATVNTFGKGEESIVFTVIKKYLPLIFSLVFYFMLINYGQSISTSMTTEKNSKIIELLVAHTKPRKLVMGKVVGNIILAIGQIMVWIVALIIGIGTSNVVSNNINDSTFINVKSMINMIKEGNDANAFSPSAIIFFLVLLVLGFAFYCIYAALIGSFINKPDQASSVFAIYTYTIVIGFMVMYFGIFTENASILNIAKYVPICIPFSAPVDVLIGNIPMMQVVIITTIMLVSVLILLYLLGVIYEKLVFNTLSLKELMRKKNA